EPTRVERDQAELQALAHLPHHVLLRHAHVRQADDAVVHRLQAHEMAAMLDLHARPAGLDEEGGDLPPLLAVTILEGVRAITTMSSARVPLVHHSFSPFRIQACPSSL